ncbi:MAG: IS200/IS605 family transposase [Saprospiraceae bacterium]
MPQSLVKNYIHLIWSTKNRKPIIDKKIEKQLYAYIAGICNKLECKVLQIGGIEDHVHIICELSKKIPLIKLLEEAKSHSSKWIKTKGDQYQNFYWQNGYAAFSVNPKEVGIVVNYIKNQEEHHKKKSFQDEYKAFLKQYKMEYDERYMWD